MATTIRHPEAGQVILDEQGNHRTKCYTTSCEGWPIFENDTRFDEAARCIVCTRIVCDSCATLLGWFRCHARDANGDFECTVTACPDCAVGWAEDSEGLHYCVEHAERVS